MRRLTIFFALLDIGILVTYAGRVPSYFAGVSHQPLLNLICLLVTNALSVSAYGLVSGRSWAFTLNYVLFPFRLALAFLSLIWLTLLILPPQPTVHLSEMVYGAAVAFEGLRLGLTIMLHIDHLRQQHNHPMRWTGPGVDAVQAG